MRWPRWFRREGTDEPVDPVDVDQLVSDGLRDAASARRVVSELKRYRAILVRRRKHLEKPLNRLAPASVRRMASSNPSTGALQMTHEMRLRDDHAEDSGRMMQLGEVQRQIEEVDVAIQQVRGQVRRPR